VLKYSQIKIMVIEERRMIKNSRELKQKIKKRLDEKAD